MQNPRRWIGYDWFKAVVALLLLILFIILLLRPSVSLPIAEADLPAYPTADFEWTYQADTHSLLNPQGEAIFSLDPQGKFWVPLIPEGIGSTLPENYRVTQKPSGGYDIFAPDGKMLYRWDASAMQWKVFSEAAVAPTATATPPPTHTPVVLVSQTPVNTMDPGWTKTPYFTSTPNVPAAPTPVFTQTPAPEATLAMTPTAELTPTPALSCQAAAVSRLAVGQTVSVVSSLNFRSSAEIGNNLLRTNPPGTKLKVLQGPVCTPYEGGAYLWWQLEMADGTIGWSAEATLDGRTYFLAP